MTKPDLTKNLPSHKPSPIQNTRRKTPTQRSWLHQQKTQTIDGLIAANHKEGKNTQM